MTRISNYYHWLASEAQHSHSTSEQTHQPTSQSVKCSVGRSEVVRAFFSVSPTPPESERGHLNSHSPLLVERVVPFSDFIASLLPRRKHDRFQPGTRMAKNNAAREQSPKIRVSRVPSFLARASSHVFRLVFFECVLLLISPERGPRTRAQRMGKSLQRSIARSPETKKLSLLIIYRARGTAPPNDPNPTFAIVIACSLFVVRSFGI